MKNMTLRTKILMVAAVPAIILTLLMAVLAHNNMSNLGKSNIELIENYSLESSKSAVKDYVDIALTAIAPIYNDSSLSEADAKKQALAVLRAMTFNNGNYIFVYSFDGTNLATRPKPQIEGKNLMSLKDPNGKPLVRDLIDIAKKDGGFYDYIWFNPATEKDEDKLSYATGLKKWKWMIGTGVYLDSLEKQVGTAKEQVEQQVTSATLIKTALVIIGLIILSIVALWAANSISKPIRRISEILQQVASGDLTPRSDYTSNDEIGNASASLNSFLNKTSEIISGVSQSANTLSESAEVVNRVSSETYNAISQQDEDTTSIAAAVEEMSVSAQEIALNGNSVKDSATDASRKTSQGAESVKTNLESMKMLAKDIDVAADAVSAVEKRTAEIQSMLEVIHSVTEQTNLLALNAAIEAARAGEQGRGFAVVADEVRALARRSGESAEEIRRIIEGLITDTQSAVGTMMSSKDRSESNLEQTQVMADSLIAIDSAINDILEKSAQIAYATSEQNTVAQEIAGNTSRIKDISKETADKMHSTTQSSQELDRLSKDLIANVGFFKH